MIIRISQEGQYRMADEHLLELNRLDDAAVAAVDAGDEPAYREALAALVAFVRTQGALVADDELMPSDVILPPADLSLDEAAAELDAEGLIPG